MSLSFRLASTCDTSLLARTPNDLFDNRVDPTLLAEFLDDPRHHIAIVEDGGVLAGFVSAVDYIHPDKHRQLWINEIAVASAHRQRGVGMRLIELMFDHAHSLGCREAWLLASANNDAANKFYRSIVRNDRSEAIRQVMYTFDLT